MTSLSRARADEILDALRRGTVPESALDAFAVGLDPYRATLEAELDQCAQGRGRFKALRGEYGTGKTFFARWFQGLSKNKGFAAAEVQISETETPLHRLETVYRRLTEHLSTAEEPRGALRSIIDGWFYSLEEEVVSRDAAVGEGELLAKTATLMRERLRSIERHAPAFGACLRAYRESVAAGQEDVASGLIAWMSGQPNVSASVKRSAGIKGDIDHFGALGFLQGLLVILRDTGFAGLVLVLDEVETLQRVRGDVREKSLNALRQFMDEVDAGRFPGLYLLITGTPSFFDGPQGAQRLPPLAQRLHVDFGKEARFDNPRAVQIRLQPFDMPKLIEVGRNVRGVFASRATNEDRILKKVDDALLGDLAATVTGHLGGKVGVAPRIFLKKLVAEVLDRVDQFPDFEPRRDYGISISAAELNSQERRAISPDDIELDL
ncbi:MAG: BREX system ATP-binding protein BrxD [Pseudomonadota bacterium]|nr:BREX system ATP-binding protein BrxD [Pseudomonadota bacterium]